MKKLAAYLLALLLVLQIVPVVAQTYVSEPLDTDAEFRSAIEIVNGSGSTLLVGKTIDLSVPEGYNDVEWSSSNEAVATIDQNGVVTGVAPGNTTITVKSGNLTANTNIIVVEPASNETGHMTVLVNGIKSTVTYDGEEHVIEYTLSSDSDDFDETAVKLNRALPSRKEAGAGRGDLVAEDFTYEGNDNVTFIVNNGSVWIKPAQAIVKADDVEIELNDISNLKLTATETGVLEGESLVYDLNWPEMEVAGEYEIVPTGSNKQGNYTVSFEKGKLTITEPEMYEAPLYNLAKINGTNSWARLRKTTIKTIKPLNEYVATLKSDGHQVTLKDNEYRAEPYDFENEILEYKGKKYAYITRANEEGLDVDGYYTAKLNEVETLTAAKNKIGGMNNNKPTWLISEGNQYKEENKTNSFHRNFTVTFNDSLKRQDIFNMLSVNGNMNYYRMRKTEIVAVSYDKASSPLKEGDYILAPYDFTNVKLVLDGEEYTYSDHIITDEYYDNYYTVKFENVVKETLINKKDDWFRNETGWLDGAKEQYGSIPNNSPGFHANYKATTYKGVKPPRSVTISSDWPKGEIAYTGAVITLTAHLEGFGENVTFQWQRSKNRTDWEDIPNANDITYTYTLDDDTAQYVWRVVADE